MTNPKDSTSASLKDASSVSDYILSNGRTWTEAVMFYLKYHAVTFLERLSKTMEYVSANCPCSSGF